MYPRWQSMLVDMLIPGEEEEKGFYRWVLLIYSGETLGDLFVQVASRSMYHSMHICHNMQECAISGKISNFHNPLLIVKLLFTVS